MVRFSVPGFDVVNGFEAYFMADSSVLFEPFGQTRRYHYFVKYPVVFDQGVRIGHFIQYTGYSAYHKFTISRI